MPLHAYLLSFSFRWRHDRVPGDNIDDYDDGDDYDYHDSNDSKMWQNSLPHKKQKVCKIQKSLNFQRFTLSWSTDRVNNYESKAIQITEAT